MSRRRSRHRVALVVFLCISLALIFLALAIHLMEESPQDTDLDRAYLSGMEMGQRMCLGLRPERERAPAAAPAQRPAARPLGGLL